MKKNGEIFGIGARNAMKKSLTDEVYDTLLKKFIDKELVPGQVLNRRSVAKELNVSVAPVLEAFLYLEMEGYVETLPPEGDDRQTDPEAGHLRSVDHERGD